MFSASLVCGQQLFLILLACYIAVNSVGNTRAQSYDAPWVEAMCLCQPKVTSTNAGAPTSNPIGPTLAAVAAQGSQAKVQQHRSCPS